jgi:hypothetical protein
MRRHPYDFTDPAFETKTLKLQEIATVLVEKYDLNIGIQGDLTLEDCGDKFNFFVRDEQEGRVMLLQSNFEIPKALKEEIIDSYNKYLYFNQIPV